MYSFDQYSADLSFSRRGNHNTVAYNCLGLIGELGELIDEVIPVFPDAQNEYELAIFGVLYEFLDVSKKAELLKKRVRKAQISALVNISISSDNKLKEELGGIIWYLDTLATNLQLSLGQAAYDNKEMLKRRFDSNPNWMVDNNKTH